MKQNISQQDNNSRINLHKSIEEKCINNQYENALEELHAFLNASAATCQDYNIAGNLYKKLKQYDQAIIYYKKSLEINKDYIIAAENLAALYIKLKQFSLAKEHYERLLGNNPDNFSANYGLAYCLALEDKPDQSFIITSKLIENDNKNKPLLNLHLNNLMNTNQFDEIIQLFNPQNTVNTQLTLDQASIYAQALYHTKSYEEANKICNTIISEAPSSPIAYLLKGHIALKLNRFEEALNCYLKQLEIEPSDDLYFNIATLYMYDNRLNDAIDYYKTILQNNPKYYQAHENIANIHLSKGNKRTALDHYRLSYAVHPHQTTKYIIQALEGKSAADTDAPDDFVSNLFNKYAPYYDEHLTSVLKYNLPRTICDILLDHNVLRSNDKINVLDLGCGTGLIGQAIASYCNVLDGIDLSPNMLAIAQEKNIYTSLIENSISEFNNKESYYGLITIIDVLPYISTISNLLDKVYHNLKSNGFVILSFEKPKKSDTQYKLQDTIRYCHSLEYVKDEALKHHFKVLYEKELKLRENHKKPILGFILLLEKN